MFCVKCGTQLPEGANFCLKCGTQVAGASILWVETSFTTKLFF